MTTQTTTTTAAGEVLDRLYRSVEAGTPIDPSLFDPDAVFDATVPGWRFHRHGPAAIVNELGGWFADPGRFEDFRRTPLPAGALVEFTLRWQQSGVPHACHQAHVVECGTDGRVARLTAWCGGRWPANLLAEMAAADDRSRKGE